MSKMKLVLASNNNKKLIELGALLSPLGFELIPQGQLGIPEADEPYGTFIENALTKARHASKASGLPAIADDSGISVQALKGEPGVQSARYAQHVDKIKYPVKNDAVNNELLLQQMKGMHVRDARFICTLVAVRHDLDPEPLVAVGRWNGEITHQLKGGSGFGYDPLMLIPELNKTVAELSELEKNTISHRALAMKEMEVLMRSYWTDLFA